MKKYAAALLSVLLVCGCSNTIPKENNSEEKVEASQGKLENMTALYTGFAEANETIDDKSKIGEIFSGFKSNYLNVVKIMFLMNLKILLWLFLFIVPGFIKAYEYSMIPYLLAENPNLSADEAFSLSKQMTTGQKMDLFVLDLSFLGWIILGLICCGIGILFVLPYPEATNAEVYLILKESVKI